MRNGDRGILAYGADGRAVPVMFSPVTASGQKGILACGADGTPVVMQGTATRNGQAGILAEAADGRAVPVSSPAGGNILFAGPYRIGGHVTYSGCAAVDTVTGEWDVWPVVNPPYSHRNDYYNFSMKLGYGFYHTGGTTRVQGFAKYESDLIAVGLFNYATDIQCHCVARHDTASNTWGPLDPANGFTLNNTNYYPVAAIALGSDLYVAEGQQIGYTWKAYSLHRWDGVSWSDVSPGGSFTCLCNHEGTLLIGHSDNTIKRLDGAVWTVAHTASGYIDALTTGPDGNLWAGGGFYRIDTTYANYLARLNNETGQWESLGVSTRGGGTNRRVWRLCTVGSRMYMAGEFTVLDPWGGEEIPSVHIGAYDTALDDEENEIGFLPVTTESESWPVCLKPLGDDILFLGTCAMHGGVDPLHNCLIYTGTGFSRWRHGGLMRVRHDTGENLSTPVLDMMEHDGKAFVCSGMCFLPEPHVFGHPEIVNGLFEFNPDTGETLAADFTNADFVVNENGSIMQIRYAFECKGTIYCIANITCDGAVGMKLLKWDRENGRWVRTWTVEGETFTGEPGWRKGITGHVTDPESGNVILFGADVYDPVTGAVTGNAVQFDGVHLTDFHGLYSAFGLPVSNLVLYTSGGECSWLVSQDGDSAAMRWYDSEASAWQPLTIPGETQTAGPPETVISHACDVSRSVAASCGLVAPWSRTTERLLTREMSYNECVDWDPETGECIQYETYTWEEEYWRRVSESGLAVMTGSPASPSWSFMRFGENLVDDGESAEYRGWVPERHGCHLRTDGTNVFFCMSPQVHENWPTGYGYGMRAIGRWDGTVPAETSMPFGGMEDLPLAGYVAPVNLGWIMECDETPSQRVRRHFYTRSAADPFSSTDLLVDPERGHLYSFASLFVIVGGPRTILRPGGGVTRNADESLATGTGRATMLHDGATWLEPLPVQEQVRSGCVLSRSYLGG